MKIYMISMSHDERSKFYRELVLPTWEKRGHTVDHFEAVTPDTLDQYKDLTFADRRNSGGNYFFSDTEKSIWYSHFLLWKKCVEDNEPIHIIEHDSYLLDELPIFSDSEIELFALHDYRYDKKNKYPSQVVSPCAGYYITPKAANVLINKSVSSIITLNVDWTVHETYEDFHDETQRNYDLFLKNLVPQCVVQQLYNEDIGSTIEHDKKSEELK